MHGLKSKLFILLFGMITPIELKTNNHQRPNELLAVLWAKSRFVGSG
jgi:hypothetical protein